MDWLTFAGSVIGGIIGGLFTFLGVRATIRHDDKKKQQGRIEKANQEKPRFEIESLLNFSKTKSLSQLNNDCNVLALSIKDFKLENGKACFFYDKKSLDTSNLVFVEYTFINTGLTEIEEICVSSNLQRWMSLVELERKDFYFNNHLLNYGVWANKRYIKHNESFKLRVYYVDGQIPTTTFQCPELIVWLKDVNGFFWSQTLNAPFNEIEISKMTSYSELKESVNIKKAIECFIDPTLW